MTENKKKKPYNNRYPADGSSGGSTRSGHATRQNAETRRRTVQKQKLLLGGGTILCLLLAIAAVRGSGKNDRIITSSSASETSAPETVFSADSLLVNGIDLSGLSRQEAREAILAAYPWNISVSYQGDLYPLDDLIAPALDSFLDRLCSGDPSGTYSFTPASESAFAQAASAAAEQLAKKIDKPAENSSISGYDASTDRFIFSDGSNGLELDQEKLIGEITDAVSEGRLDAELEAAVHETSPELSAEEARNQYQLLASFTTETTDNAKRNTNVRLAAEALNGTIVKSGAEFSFNDTVGERTAEKGYQEAAAYNSGEVVQEIGGGVCQISSTLYHTVFQAGMQITYRRSHTFEPNYVTPGQDAAISWRLPDFRFINTSSAAIGIRASYENRQATVAIYGIPVLEEGVTLSLESEKTEELPPPEPTYIEDQTLTPGTEIVEKSASNGSHWVTYKIVSKNGKVTERIKDHEKTYKGHAAVIRRNTSGTVLAPEETSVPETTVAPTVDGMPEDYVPGESIAPESSAPAPEVPETTAAPSLSEPAETGTASRDTEAPEGSVPLEPGSPPAPDNGPKAPSGDGSISELPPEPGL